MKLRAWLDREQMSVERFACEIDAKYPSVLKWADGERFPRRGMLMKIIKVTNGEVTPNDFL